MADQAIYSPMRVLDANGEPVPGALVTFYATGTTILIDVFSDIAGTVLATNPVVADADGNLPQRWVKETAKAVVATAAAVTLRTIDPVPVSPAGGAGAAQVSFAPVVNIPVANVQDAIELVDTNARARDAALGDLAALDTVGTAQVTPSALVTEAEGLASSDNDTSLPTTAAVRDYVDRATIGGTPQQLSGSRIFGTTYQNTTGRPIFATVTVRGNGTAGSALLRLGATAGTLADHASVSAENAFDTPVSFFVPAGWHYRVNNSSGSPFIAFWSEARV